MGSSCESCSERQINWVWSLDTGGEGGERGKMMVSFTEAGNTEVSHLETRGFTLVFRIHSYILNALNLRYQRGIQIEMSYMW